ncbi:MAG: holin [Ruminococcus sp.]|nr:holin [Ruminococcus sp.]
MGSRFFYTKISEGKRWDAWLTSSAPLITATATIICAVVAAQGNKLLKTRRQEENLAKKRTEDARLQMQIIAANSDLTVGIALALQNGRANGKVEKGLAAVKSANGKYTQIFRRESFGRYQPEGGITMSKEFWKNTAIRAVKTFCQSLVAAISVGAAVSEVNWLNALSVALVAGLVSVLTSLASLDTVCEPSDNADEDDTDDSEVGG